VNVVDSSSILIVSSQCAGKRNGTHIMLETNKYCSTTCVSGSSPSCDISSSTGRLVVCTTLDGGKSENGQRGNPNDCRIMPVRIIVQVTCVTLGHASVKAMLVEVMDHLVTGVPGRHMRHSLIKELWSALFCRALGRSAVAAMREPMGLLGPNGGRGYVRMEWR